MSYNIYLKGVTCDKCGHAPEGPELPNPTYNLTPIFDLALTGDEFPNPDVRPRGLRILSDKKASETEKSILMAITRMSEPGLAERFAALEPENGWGDLGGARRVLTKLLNAAKEYPDHVWEIR